ncbi:hypothetical protein OHW85_18220 [Acinetobacter baumannii]|jgi:hypothetical protein|nr:hypothetical protein [Acinetobacter baumannii]
MTLVERQKIIDNTNASFFLEGIEPDAEMKRLQALYVTGEIASALELGKLTRSHLKTKSYS